MKTLQCLFAIAISLVLFSGCKTPSWIEDVEIPDIVDDVDVPEIVDDKPDAPLPETNDAVPVEFISWFGKSYRNAQQTCTLSSASIRGNTLSFSPAAPSSWPRKTVKVECQAIVCLFFERSGQVVGGKFDWARPGQSSKGLENIHNGYNGHTMPPKGTPTYVMLVDVNERQRSNIQQVDWK